MRLFNFKQERQRRLGVSIDGRLLDVTDLSEGYIGSILDYLWLSEKERHEFSALVRSEAAALEPLDEETIHFLSVVERENKFMCIGQNYLDHCREQGVEPPRAPIMFAKFDNALAGHREEIPAPVSSQEIDFEVELAVVIGRPCHRVSCAEAPAYVGGYTIVNDLTARDHQKRDGQWVRAKSLDKFGPNGPLLVTADEVPDPHALALRLELNGRCMQQSNTANLIFGVFHLIHYYSQDISLRPGDLIATGTPPGVGAFRNPPVWLKPGDRMEASVEGLGTLVNTIASSLY